MPLASSGRAGRVSGPATATIATDRATAMPRAERIAVFRALPGLGDMVCAIPALEALRAGFPAARIVLVGLEAHRWMLGHLPLLLDDYVDVPPLAGLHARPGPTLDVLCALSEVSEGDPDLILQMHGDGSRSNAYSRLLGDGIVVAPRAPGGFEPDIEAPLRSTHEVGRCLDVALAAGAEPLGPTPQLPVGSDDRTAGRALVGLGQRPYVVVAPGASQDDRRWSVDGFVRVIDEVSALGVPVVLVGSSADGPTCAAVVDRSVVPPLDLSGRTSVGVLAAVVAEGCLCVCNDSGPSHVAVAVGTPSVVVWSGSEVRRWAPLDRYRHVVVGGEDRVAHADEVAALVAQRLGRVLPTVGPAR